MEGHTYCKFSRCNKIYNFEEKEEEQKVMRKRNLRVKIAAVVLGAAVALGTMSPTLATRAMGLEGTESVETEMEQRGVAADLTISNARELNEFAQKVNNGNDYEDKVIKLTNDIVFDGVTVNNFTPIGLERSFSGIFDGCGYTISGIDVTNQQYAALFGNIIGGEVKNVVLKNSSFSGKWCAAGICAEFWDGTISNCHVYNCTIYTGNLGMKDYGKAGAISAQVAWNGGSAIIKNCSSNSIVKSEVGYIGGIAGYFGKGSIVNCCNNGIVTGGGGTAVGGICGYVNGTVQNCFNTGSITGADQRGGIVGYGGSGSIVANCYTLDTAATTNFGSMNGTERECKAYSDAYMQSADFLNQLNANRGSNGDWFRWELRADSVYPQQVKLTNIAKCNAGLAAGSCVYNGKSQTPAVSITDGSYSLVQDVDYTISYTNNVDAGNATAIISGNGMYTGDITIPFTIQKANRAISYKKSITKTYGAKAFSLGAKLTAGSGKLSYSTSNAKVAKVDGTGNVTIKGTGKAVISISCSGDKNHNAGAVSSTITVKPKQQSVSAKMNGGKMKITWKKDSKASGYQIQYASNKSFSKNCKTITVSKKGKTSQSVGKLKKGKAYYVRVRSYKTISENGQKTIVAGAWSKAKKASR